MVQHRTALSLASGTFTLINGLAVLGLFGYGFSLYILADRQMVASPLFHAAEIALTLLTHTFSVLMGTVFWKLRLADQRADLLSSLQRSVTAVTALDMVIVAISVFRWNSSAFFGLALPLLSLAALFVVSLHSLFFDLLTCCAQNDSSAQQLNHFWSIDLLEERCHMVCGAVQLLSTSLCVLFVDTIAKLHIRHDLMGTGSPVLIEQAMESDASIFASLLVFICLVRVYSILLFCSPKIPPPMETANQSTNTRCDGRSKSNYVNQDSDFLPREMLESAHLWLLAAAFFSLLGLPIAPLLLTSAVLMGATLKPRVWDGKADIFFRVGENRQRQIELDY